MALPRNAEARRFYRAAFERLEDGTRLLEDLGRPNVSIYMTGYAVECILKALILQKTPVGRRRNLNVLFETGQGHNLVRLRKAVERTGINVSLQRKSDLALLSVWSVDLRYDPERGDVREASQFLQAARRVVEWADERI